MITQKKIHLLDACALLRKRQHEVYPAPFPGPEGQLLFIYHKAGSGQHCIVNRQALIAYARQLHSLEELTLSLK